MTTPLVRLHPVRGWLSVDDVADPVQLKPGDSFLLPRGKPLRLASDLSLPSVDAATLFADHGEWNYRLAQRRRRLLYCCAHFALARQSCHYPLGSAAAGCASWERTDKMALRCSLDRMISEVLRPNELQVW